MQSTTICKFLFFGGEGEVGEGMEGGREGARGTSHPGDYDGRRSLLIKTYWNHSTNTVFIFVIFLPNLPTQKTTV